MGGMMCQKCAQNIVSKIAAKYGPTHFLIKFLKEMPWVRTLRPFSTQYFAHIFGTSCQPSGHHFMDHGSVLCAHFRHNILRTFLVHHANHLGTISWTQWTPSPLPSFPFPSPSHPSLSAPSGSLFPSRLLSCPPLGWLFV